MSSFLPVPLRRHTMVGVDIGASSVKVVEISAARGGRALTLHRCASELLEKGTVVNGSLVDLQAVSRALSSALRKARIRCPTATLALPHSLTEYSTPVSCSGTNSCCVRPTFDGRLGSKPNTARFCTA